MSKKPTDSVTNAANAEAAVLSGQHGKVALIRLNRPDKLNALSSALFADLNAALATAEADDGTSVIVLTGNGKAFAAGADIAEMAAHATYADVEKIDFISNGWEDIARCRKPIIAAVNGYALGGGCELAMMCDIILAADNAQFAQPEVKLAIPPGIGGTQRLPRAIGKYKAMELCLTGRMLPADEAERIGLVARVFPAADLVDEAMAMATTIAGYSLPVLRAIKNAVNAAGETTLAQGVAYERRHFHACFALDDRREGMQAFLEKRKPQFNNR